MSKSASLAIQHGDSLARDKARALARVPVSPETETRLDRYVALLLEWQAKTNLVAPSTLPEIWTRHVADSLQLLAIAPEARRWADFGSGGGFPGVVLGCALAEREGGMVHLVERNNKKAAFLREAVRVTGAKAMVHAVDIGDYVDKTDSVIECVTARAVAPLHILFGFAEPLVRRGAIGLFMKGQDVASEISDATKYWGFSPKLHPSSSGGGGAIVEVRSIAARGSSAQTGVTGG